MRLNSSIDNTTFNYQHGNMRKPPNIPRCKLEAWIRSQGLQQQEFAKLIPVRPTAVCRWLSGERIPRPNQIRRIVEVTQGQITANDLLRLETA
jgi:hypothetical protein